MNKALSDLQFDLRDRGADARDLYDTRSGIEGILKEHGLAGLDVLSEARRTAGYERKERLGTWVIWGRVSLGSTGNTYPITEGAPADVGYYRPGRDYEPVPTVMTMEETKEWTSHLTSTCVSVPKSYSRCPHCGEGWSSRNIRDFIYRDGEFAHKECVALQRHQQDWTQLNRIRTAAGLGMVEAYPIPSQYSDNRVYCGPWMVLKTQHGQIRMGWRKRVISIQWDDTNEAITAPFEQEDVTKDAHLIHAWGEEKAIAYLTALRKHFEAKPV